MRRARSRVLAILLHRVDNLQIPADSIINRTAHQAVLRTLP